MAMNNVHMNDVCQQFDSLRTEFLKFSQNPWFLMNNEQKMSITKQELRSQLYNDPQITCLQSRDLISSVVDATITKEALLKYMIKYKIRSLFKIASHFTSQFQKLFSHFQDPNLYVTIGLESEYFSDDTDTVLNFPVKKPVVQEAWQFLSAGLYHHWTGNAMGYFSGDHFVRNAYHKFVTIDANIESVPVIIIEFDNGNSSSLIVPRVFAPVAIEFWKKDLYSTRLIQMTKYPKIDENLSEMSKQIRDAHPWITMFKKYKTYTVEALILYNKCLMEYEDLQTQYSVIRKQKD
jgi:hypothetical protein